MILLIPSKALSVGIRATWQSSACLARSAHFRSDYRCLRRPEASSYMSSLSTFLRPLPAVRRAYSVYTKPGGGRFFNAAKSLTQPNNTNKPEVDTAGATNAPETGNSGGVVEDNKPNKSPSSNVDVKTALAPLSIDVNFTPYPVHPRVNPQDLRLHQFFSLHRPLLTLSQPASSVFETAPNSLPFSPLSEAEAARHGTIDESPEALPESDADAARLLARALVSSRVGAALAWQNTLKRLGLDESPAHAAEVVQAQAEFDVYMDSTRRKRRKKMKKHKCAYIPRLFKDR
jgi:hypothetical protein